MRIFLHESDTLPSTGSLQLRTVYLAGGLTYRGIDARLREYTSHANPTPPMPTRARLKTLGGSSTMVNNSMDAYLYIYSVTEGHWYYLSNTITFRTVPTSIDMPDGVI